MADLFQVPPRIAARIQVKSPAAPAGRVPGKIDDPARTQNISLSSNE